MKRRVLRGWLVLMFMGVVLSLLGCNLDVLNLKGSVGVVEKVLIVMFIWVMLIVVVLVILFMLWFVWCYCVLNCNVVYVLNWLYLIVIEVVIWIVLMLIILFFGVFMWKIIYEFDLYKLFELVVKLFDVEVVVFDWKWLFIYLEFGIVLVN